MPREAREIHAYNQDSFNMVPAGGRFRDMPMVEQVKRITNEDKLL